MLLHQRIIFVIFFALSCFKSAYAQVNLVPNFGFEQYDMCPTSGDQAEYCTGWSKYSNLVSTPDYYNACSSSNALGVPQSYLLHQFDQRNCGAYMGLVTWTNNPNEREHIGIELSQPLVVGQKYYLSFYTVMAGTDDGSIYYESPSNNIGIRLSTVPYASSNPAPIDNFAHLKSISIINDTMNWAQITGSIVADSAYQYLILGNFYDDANTDTTTLTCVTCQNLVSYYLIDDICVSTDSTLCNGGLNLLPCTVSVEEIDFDTHFSVFPSPTSNIVTVRSSLQAPFDVFIYNAFGLLLFVEQNIISINEQFDLSNFQDGLLFIEIASNSENFIFKILKQ